MYYLYVLCFRRNKLCPEDPGRENRQVYCYQLVFSFETVLKKNNLKQQSKVSFDSKLLWLLEMSLALKIKFDEI